MSGYSKAFNLREKKGALGEISILLLNTNKCTQKIEFVEISETVNKCKLACIELMWKDRFREKVHQIL